MKCGKDDFGWYHCFPGDQLENEQVLFQFALRKLVIDIAFDVCGKWIPKHQLAQSKLAEHLFILNLISWEAVVPTKVIFATFHTTIRLSEVRKVKTCHFMVDST